MDLKEFNMMKAWNLKNNNGLIKYIFINDLI